MFEKTRKIIRKYIENRKEYSNPTDFYSDQVLWWPDKTLKWWKFYENNWVELRQIEEIMMHDFILKISNSDDKNKGLKIKYARLFMPMMSKFFEWCYFNNIKRNQADKLKREMIEEAEDFSLDSFR